LAIATACPLFLPVARITAWKFTVLLVLAAAAAAALAVAVANSAV